MPGEAYTNKEKAPADNGCNDFPDGWVVADDGCPDDEEAVGGAGYSRDHSEHFVVTVTPNGIVYDEQMTLLRAEIKTSADADTTDYNGADGGVPCPVKVRGFDTQTGAYVNIKKVGDTSYTDGFEGIWYEMADLGGGVSGIEGYIAFAHNGDATVLRVRVQIPCFSSTTYGDLDGAANLTVVGKQAEYGMIFGGYDRDGLLALDDVEKYISHYDTWYSMTSMMKGVETDSERYGCAATALPVVADLETCGFVCGGQQLGSLRMITTQKYIMQSDVWANVTSLPLKRSNHGFATSYNGVGDYTGISVGGNQTGLGNEDTITSSYDPDDDAWTDRAVYPRESVYAIGVSDLLYLGDGYVMCYGGYERLATDDGDGAAYGNVYQYVDEAPLGTYTEKAPFPAPSPRRFCGACDLGGGTNHVFGGSGATNIFDNALVYDRANDTWTINATMPDAGEHRGRDAFGVTKIDAIGDSSSPQAYIHGGRWGGPDWPFYIPELQADYDVTYQASFQYDPVGDAFTTKSDMPEPARQQLAACTL